MHFLEKFNCWAVCRGLLNVCYAATILPCCALSLRGKLSLASNDCCAPLIQNYDYDDNSVMGMANYIYKGSASKTGGRMRISARWTVDPFPDTMTKGKTKTRATHRQTEPHFVLMVILIFSDLSTFCYARRAENAKVVKRIHQGQERFNQRVSGLLLCYNMPWQTFHEDILCSASKCCNRWPDDRWGGQDHPRSLSGHVRHLYHLYHLYSTLK